MKKKFILLLKDHYIKYNPFIILYPSYLLATFVFMYKIMSLYIIKLIFSLCFLILSIAFEVRKCFHNYRAGYKTYIVFNFLWFGFHFTPNS